jgi:hypothetical protein
MAPNPAGSGNGGTAPLGRAERECPAVPERHRQATSQVMRMT